MSDSVLLLLLTALLFLAAVLKIQLKKKQGKPYSNAWTVQLFVFPVLCLIAWAAFQLGQDSLVIPVIFLGIGEEILCWAIRKRQEKAEKRD
jgi:hypothetical protein